MQKKINETEIHQKSNNHHIPRFIFWRHFDDERIINYEWPYRKLTYLKTSCIFLALFSIFFKLVSFPRL